MWASKIIVVLLFVAAQVAQPGSSNFIGTDLEALCKKQSSNLTRRSDFDLLYQQQALSSAAGSQCPAYITNCLNSLKRLFGEKKKILCTMTMAQNIKEFHKNHLDTSIKLPKEVRNFALAYLMQVSNVCKKNMVDVLVRHAKEGKDKPSLIGAQEEITKFLESFGEQGEILVPHQLGSLLSSDTIIQRLIVRAKMTSSAEQSKKICEQRLKPIYESAVMPVTVLASIGLDYKDDELKRRLEDEDVKLELKYWSSVTFICELMEDVYMTENGAKKNRLDIGIEDSYSESISGEQGGSTSKGDPIERTQSPAVSVSIPDLIYDKQNKELVSAIERFRTDKYPELRIRKRFLERILPLLRSKKLNKPVNVHLSPELKRIVQIYVKMDPEIGAILIPASKMSKICARSSSHSQPAPEPKTAILPLILLIITVIIMSIFLGTDKQ